MKPRKTRPSGHLITVRCTNGSWVAGSNTRARVAALASLRFLLADWHPRCSIGIYLTDDSELACLNLRYRGCDHPTNILSFPMIGLDELKEGAFPEPILLGDLALAWPLIGYQATAQDKNPLDHLSHLVVHGVLHLLGYHHDNPKQSCKMEALEVQILDQLQVADPYKLQKGNPQVQDSWNSRITRRSESLTT